MRRHLLLWLTAFVCLLPLATTAQTVYNTHGAKEGVAINGYDTVAYFTEKKAVQGSPEFEHDWGGAKWHFSSAENKRLFVAEPEKYAPQYGGYCALNVAFGRLSKKPASTDFEVYRGKLYLFGEASGSMTPKQNWWGNPMSNIHYANREWERIKKELVP